MTPIRIAISRAGTWQQRLRGLIGRPPPAAGTGLLLEPCRAIHTIGLRGPIDVVFLDRRGFVVRVLRGLGVRRFAWCGAAYATLELRLGEASRLGLWEGCRLDLAEHDPRLGTVEPEMRLDCTEPETRLDRAGSETRPTDTGPSGTRRSSAVRRQPKRGAST
jgi:hypothetical protein